MEKEELKNLIIYTGVYHDGSELYNVRSKLWFQTFDNAQKLGIKVVVRNDGGAGLTNEMLERIKAYENITIVEKDPLKNDTLGSGRREALEKALEIAKAEGIEHPVFLWTEPEKSDLITEKNLKPLVAEINAGANMVIPERGERAWSQLPDQQRFLEQRAEKRVQTMIGSEERMDLWFGPKVLDKVGAGRFLQYNSNRDRADLWDSLMVPVLEAIKDKLKVKNVLIDFSYDKSQTKEGEEAKQEGMPLKRLEQYTQILAALGDKKWQQFFEEGKEELTRVRQELTRVREQKLKLGEDQKLKEAKQSLVRKFFKLK